MLAGKQEINLLIKIIAGWITLNVAVIHTTKR
jgi:hypothetical protein